MTEEAKGASRMTRRRRLQARYGCANFLFVIENVEKVCKPFYDAKARWEMADELEDKKGKTERNRTGNKIRNEKNK